MAHGRGFARLHNPVGGYRSWVEVRMHHTPGYEPLFLHISHPNPTGGSTSTKSFVDIKWFKVSHEVIARPRQLVGDGGTKSSWGLTSAAL